MFLNKVGVTSLLPTVIRVGIHGNTIIRSGRAGDQKPQRKYAANPDNAAHEKTPKKNSQSRRSMNNRQIEDKSS
jgi:hypothetical protein